jgi:hypothetical protein
MALLSSMGSSDSGPSSSRFSLRRLRSLNILTTASDIQVKNSNLCFSAPFVLIYCSPSQDVPPSFEATQYYCHLEVNVSQYLRENGNTC